MMPPPRGAVRSQPAAASRGQASFTLPNGGTGVGQLQVTVTTDYYDQVLEYDADGNPAYGNNQATASFTSSLAPYPELHVGNLSVDNASSLQSGGTVTVDWNDSNLGDAPASGGWYDQIQVVNTTTGQTLVNTDQTYGSNSISAGGSTPRSYSFTLPNSAPGVGQLSITVTADAGLSLLEYNSSGVIDTNRSASITAQSTLAPYPDLHATARQSIRRACCSQAVP